MVSLVAKLFVDHIDGRFTAADNRIVFDNSEGSDGAESEHGRLDLVMIIANPFPYTEHGKAPSNAKRLADSGEALSFVKGWTV